MKYPAVGHEALLNNDNDNSGLADYNTAIGYDALINNIDGSFNTALGDSALATNNTGTDLIAIGYAADVNADGYNNSIALGNSTTITASNQFVVNPNITNWNIGGVSYAIPTSQGASNTVLTNDGSGNLSWAAPTATITNAQIGYGSGSNTLTSDVYFTRNGDEIQVSDGVDNIFIGGNGQAGNNYPSNQGGGSENIGLGSGALSNIANGNNNIALGDNALATNQDGSNLIAIGAGADVNANNTYTNSIALGSTTITSSNQFVMNSLITNWNIGGVDYNIPTSQGSGVLTNDGSGNLSWGAASPIAAETLVTPSDGGSFNAIVGTNIVSLSGTLTTLSITLPSSPTNGQCVELIFTNSISTIDWSGAVDPSVTTSSAPGMDLRLFYDTGTSTWY